ncbi:MAG TPA: hypothetical protein VMH86_08760 [Rhizomicrobium sp.]|nr:hypothetical protein [Rhizomicrobium sp.]
MSRLALAFLSSAALVASGSLALAQNGASAPAGMAQPISTVSTTCHHDGEVIQTPQGLMVCHLRPMSGVHFKSRDWFAGVSARAAATNQ